MALYAIGDLHLSLGKHKPMDIFGEHWKNHDEKIKKHWLENVNDSDTILLAGDISWGIDMVEAKPDLDLINSLPGKKIMITGNHDYWWSSVSKLNYAYPEIYFIRNDFTVYKDIAICGSKGWLCPNDTYFTDQDKKIYNRERARLKMSIQSAVNAGYKKIIVMMHYPPTNDKKEESAFTELFNQYDEIKQVIYGHLHGKGSFHSSLEGIRYGIKYSLISSDYLDFELLKIEE